MRSPPNQAGGLLKARVTEGWSFPLREGSGSGCCRARIGTVGEAPFRRLEPCLSFSPCRQNSGFLIDPSYGPPITSLFSKTTLSNIESKEEIRCEACFGEYFTLGLFLKFYFFECHSVSQWLFRTAALWVWGERGQVIERTWVLDKGRPQWSSGCTGKISHPSIKW